MLGSRCTDIVVENSLINKMFEFVKKTILSSNKFPATAIIFSLKIYTLIDVRASKVVIAAENAIRQLPMGV
jgi:hypothetical protein